MPNIEALVPLLLVILLGASCAFADVFSPLVKRSPLQAASFHISSGDPLRRPESIAQGLLFSVTKSQDTKVTTQKPLPELDLTHLGVKSTAQHTLNHFQCPACAAEHQQAMQETDLASLPFEEAARLWLDAHRQYIQPRTVQDYEQYIASLAKFFGGMPLREINIGNIRAYHKVRLLPPGVQKMDGRAGACLVRMESSTLRQIMTEANLWHRIKPLYKHPPLTRREKEGAGQSFTVEQEEAFLDVAFSLKRCELTAHCARIMFRTGFGFGELRRVRRCDYNEREATITIVDGAKNDERRRLVPLVPSAQQSALWILDRWQDAGGSFDDEFLLFYRTRGDDGKPDLYRPMVSIQNGWTRIIDECVQRGTLPEGFDRRVYDCRVTAITKGLSSGDMSLHTAKKLFGHVSPAMQKRYYKPQLDILRDAVTTLEPASAQPKPKLVRKEPRRVEMCAVKKSWR